MGKIERGSREKNSTRKLRDLTSLALVVSTVLVVSWTAVMVASRTPERHVNFGILNENGEAGPFPSQVSPGETITTYFEVVNHLGRNATIQVRVSLGTSNSRLNLTTGASEVTGLANFTKTLRDGETWTSDPVNISVATPRDGLLAVYEAYEQTPDGYEFIPNKLLFFRFNCTF
ncbi:MAG: hypothetical protein Kow0069_17130 [Promethearchaeota archaeon]